VGSEARSWLGALAIAVAVLGVAGCGLGPGAGTSNVSLTVTRSFGQSRLGEVTESHAPGSETVMRMLERSFHVSTKYGGGFVQSINGHSGDSSQHDWFYYVNGIEASAGAAATAVHKGDRIWWDLHDWTLTDSVPAVVGSFPEPFLNGVGGKRLPTTVGCAPDASKACSRIAAALKAVGVPVASQLLGTGSGTDSLAVLVGTWTDMRGVIAADLVDNGPKSSGVYARFTGPSASSLQLLDPRGNVVRTLGAGAGLIAATSDNISEPTWMITGTDPAGVSAAAAALTAARLHDHFALAIVGGSDLPLPLHGGS
jgi:hypothetical protein